MKFTITYTQYRGIGEWNRCLFVKLIFFMSWWNHPRFIQEGKLLLLYSHGISTCRIQCANKYIPVPPFPWLKFHFNIKPDIMCCSNSYHSLTFLFQIMYAFHFFPVSAICHITFFFISPQQNIWWVVEITNLLILRLISQHHILEQISLCTYILLILETKSCSNVQEFTWFKVSAAK